MDESALIQAIVDAVRNDVRRDVAAGLYAVDNAFTHYRLGQDEIKKRRDVMAKLAKTARNSKPYLADAARQEAARLKHEEEAFEDELRRRREKERRSGLEPRGKGRPPIGKQAMTPAERKRRYLAKHGTKRTKVPLPSPDDDLVQEACTDCETPEQFWQTSLSNAAGDAIAMRAYWTRQFGDWQAFDAPSALVTLAKQAAQQWTELATTLNRRTKP